MTFNPLSNEGHIWLSKGVLATLSRLLELDKTSESAIATLAKTENWQTKLIAGSTFYLVPAEWAKAQLRLENLELSDFTAKGELSRKTILSVVSQLEHSSDLAATSERSHITQELTSRLSVVEAEAKKNAEELTLKSEQIQTLKKQLEEAKREALKVPGLEAAIQGRDSTISALGESIKSLASQSSVDNLIKMAQEQAKTGEAILNHLESSKLVSPDLAHEAEPEQPDVMQHIEQLADSMTKPAKPTVKQWIPSWKRA